MRASYAGAALLAASLRLSEAQSEFSFSYPQYPYGCFPNVASSAVTPTVPALAKGDTAFVCLQINGNVTSLYNVGVDQFSAISVMGTNYASPPGAGYMQEGVGYVPQIGAGPNTSNTFFTVIDMAAYNVYTSFPRVYKAMVYQPSKVDPNILTPTIYTFPVWTLIIHAEQGIIKDVAWDEGCMFCAENGPYCLPTAYNANVSSNRIITGTTLFNQCSTDQETCYPSFNPSLPSGNATYNGTLPDTGCDLKIFITWSGTDRNGQYFTSANRRFSRYRAFSIATAWQSALNLANTAVDLAQKAQSAVEAIPGQIVPSQEQVRRRMLKAKGGAAGAYAAALMEEVHGGKAPPATEGDKQIPVPLSRLAPGVREWAEAGTWPHGHMNHVEEQGLQRKKQFDEDAARGEGPIPPPPPQLLSARKSE